ncbi:acetyl-CoA carboxylase biotin carboxylase subunit family protein [Actinoplanes sp. NPDC020271]|uniref:acetyl-CoA carboxylase biotin carboxylase subunit family protein n=1 Tax=Actinoplanes sp. NPDC020271 TaxID=3363896 RepID=UPI0037B30069
MTSTSAAEPQPHLLVVWPGKRNFREYLLKSVATRYRVHLLHETEPSWEQQYLDGWTVIDDLSDQSTVEAMMAKVAEADPFDGVLCWDESWILLAARLARSFGLPGGDVEAINRCRDKHLTREALNAAGVPQPRSAAVTTVDEAVRVAAEFGYPAVVKPRALAGSLGVVKVATEAETRASFQFARDSESLIPEMPQQEASTLIEEYIDGPEISIDAAIVNGQVQVLCIARKQVGFEPHFEETGHVVDGHDPLLVDPVVLGVLSDTHAALGFRHGITHTELRLGSRGPQVIEVNARIGGDLIPYLGLRSGGPDVGLVAAAVACGQTPPTEPAAERRVAAIRYFYPPHDATVVDEVSFDSARLPAAIDRAEALAAHGDVKSPPPNGLLVGRVALAVAVAGSGAQCADALDRAEKALIVKELERR